MTEDPLDRYEELIVSELCSYQSQLDQDVPVPSDTAGEDEIPTELQTDLKQFRRCLDLIRKKRAAGDFPLQDMMFSDAWPGYSLPERIARFEIVECLGVGGFGIVFRGIDPVMGREVAIKVPRPEFLGSPELTDRFAREAEAVAQLEHPNIVPIFECDCVEVVPYIVMPYIDGQTLAEWFTKQNEVPARTAAEIVRQLATAVAHAHERGVLHRDLKPGNVLLASRESDAVGDELPFIPRLADFGLAKCANTVRPQTRTGAMIGTACYMAPEQADGRTRDITARSDIYGLGVILFELLTGQPPFRDTNELRTIQKVLHDDPPAAHSIRPGVPLDLEVICCMCLEKLPANRYKSAGALADDLKCFLNGEPIQARPIPLIARIGKWCRRNSTRTTVFTIILIALLTLAAVTSRYNGLLKSLHRSIAESEQQNRHQVEMMAKRRSYVSDMRNAKIIGDHNNITQMLTLLERYRIMPGEPDFRDFAWWYLRREYEESSRVLGVHDRGATAVAISRDGKRAASCGLDGAIQIWSLANRKLIAKLSGHEGTVASVDFSPDGDRLVSAGEDGTVRIWDLQTNGELFVCGDRPTRFLGAKYSPRGEVIASFGDNPAIQLWDAATGDCVGVLSGHSGSVLCLAFHPVEDMLVSGGGDARLFFWDWKKRCTDARIDGGAIRLPSSAHRPLSLVFDPEGKSLDVGLENATVFKFAVEPDRFGEELHRRPTNGIPHGFAWPPKGSLIAALGNPEILVSDPVDPTLPGTLKRGHQYPVVALAVSEDGASMVSASVDGEVRVWADFQKRSRLNVEPGKSSTWVDENRSYEVQWRSQFLAVDFQQGEVSLYRMPQKTLHRSLPKANEDGFVLSPLGNYLITFQMDGLVNCHDTNFEKPLWSIRLPQRSQPFFSEFAVVQKREQFAAISWENEIYIVSVKTPQTVHQIKHPCKVWQLTLVESESSPPTLISAGQDGYVRFWNAQTGQLQQTMLANAGPTYSVAVCGNLRTLATAGGDYTVRLWRYSDLVPLDVLPLNERPGPARIGFLKSGFGDTEVLVRHNFGLNLWSLHDRAELLDFSDCGQFGSMTISPDRKQIAVPQHGWIHLLDGRRQKMLENGPIKF